MKKTTTNKKLFSGTKALVMGLGLHGGGVATAKWLAKHGARVTATDMRDKKTLAPSVAALKGVSVRFVLGTHEAKDFSTHDLVVVNPGVPRESVYLAIAQKSNTRIENDASLFFRYNENPVIAVTGTRGKTTTTLWIAELLKKKYPDTRPSGNTPENAFLKEFDRVHGKGTPVAGEMSSWQLEYLPVSGRAPHVAVITNLYPDHLNRYKSIRDYAAAKANIFHDQHPDDFLILNADDVWTKFFLAKKPRSLIFYTSKKPLVKGMNGIFVRAADLVFRFDGIEQKLFSVKRFLKERGEHNLSNLLAAVLALKLFDPTLAISEKDILTLPTPRMREEIVFQKGALTVVNDSCATSPDGTIAAIKRFTNSRRPTSRIVLITGGTDKALEFGDLATVINKHIPPEQLVLLEGSATTKLSSLLPPPYSQNEKHHTLRECVAKALVVACAQKGDCTILFSPGAASFEKFLHEFDRGERFNAIIKRQLRR